MCPSGSRRHPLKYFSILLQKEEARSLSMIIDVMPLLNSVLLFKVLRPPDLP